jgi:signal transduction histidine kinase
MKKIFQTLGRGSSVLRRIFFGLIVSFLYISGNLAAVPCGSLIYDLNRPIELESEWQFRKGDNLDWKEPSVEESFWVKRKIPDYGISKSENISGYHWYRCKIYLNENFQKPRAPLGIRLGKIRDMDEVYWNGVLIGKTGSLVPRYEPDFHRERIYSIPTQLLLEGENILSLRIYATGYQQGLKSIPIIANEEDLIRSKYSSEALAVGFGYLFILMGIYFLTGSFIRGLRAENSYFGLFSILIGLYTLIRSQYRYQLFDSFTSSYTFELMILIPLPALFINFLIHHLDSKRNNFVLGNELFLGVLFFATPFLRSTAGWNTIIQFFNYGLPVSVGIAVYYIAKHFRSHSAKLKFILLGLIGLMPTIAIDSLVAMEVISVPGTIYFGFFFFLIFISVQLSEEMVSSLKKYLNMETELIQMEKIKTGFLVNISNEFRIGIEKVSSLLAKLKSSKSSKNEKSALEQLEAQVENTLAMIDEAILLKKIENKEYFPEKTTFDANMVLKEIHAKIERRLDQKRKNSEVHVQPKEAFITTDRVLFSAIARNLIENAYVYTDKSVRVEVEFQIVPGKYILVVADEGLGMNHFEQENLFKKFVRGDKDKMIPGAGIGLTLCKRALELLDGEITVKSAEGMGTVFRIQIPVGKVD